MLTILTGDALTKLRELPDESVQCCVTSPPYWGLRDYGTASWEGGDDGCDHKQGRDGAGRADGIVDERGQRNRDGVGAMGGDCGKCGAKRIDSQLGLEKTPDEYVAKMVEVFREVRRVLRKDGTLWMNLGDSYFSQGGSRTSCVDTLTGQGSRREAESDESRTVPHGFKPKDLCGIPWRVAFALQADGWWLRSDIIWNKANCMPESVTDRPTRSHEYLFLMTKSARYYYDSEAIKEPASESDWESRIGRANLNNKLLPTDEINGIRPRVKYTPNGKDKHGSTLTGDLYGCHFLGDEIPKKERRADKQRGHSRRHDGFNDGWDQMEKSEQCSGTRNKRDVWTIAPANFPEAHFATYPPDLIKPCIMAGTRAGDTVLDPFAGSGTTGMVSIELGRQAILIELNPKYVKLIEQRCDVTPGLPL